MVQTFSAPLRSLRKTIRFPSGENRGWLSKAIPPLISFCISARCWNRINIPKEVENNGAASGDRSTDIQVPLIRVNWTLHRFQGQASSFFFSGSVFLSSLFGSCAFSAGWTTGTNTRPINNNTITNYWKTLKRISS